MADAVATPLVSISVEQFNVSMARYIQEVGVSMREALFEEWPLLIRKIMDFTPPFQTAGASGSSDLSVGRAAVSRDIQRTMRPFNPAARSKHLEKILDQRNVAAFNSFAARVKTGPMAAARAVAFSPEVHRSQRDGRGVVQRAVGDRVLGSDVGLLRKYIKDETGKVGIAKSGWLPALVLVGGQAPGYVSKHGMGQGSVIDNHADENSPSLTAINRTPWATRKDEGTRIINAALKSRSVAILAKMRAKLRLAAKQAKLDQVAA